MELTTDHPQSSYHIPGLLVDGVAYGGYDKLPTGEIAFAVVLRDMNRDDPLVKKFISSCPDLLFAE